MSYSWLLRARVYSLPHDTASLGLAIWSQLIAAAQTTVSIYQHRGVIHPSLAHLPTPVSHMLRAPTELERSCPAAPRSGDDDRNAARRVVRATRNDAHLSQVARSPGRAPVHARSPPGRGRACTAARPPLWPARRARRRRPRHGLPCGCGSTRGPHRLPRATRTPVNARGDLCALTPAAITRSAGRGPPTASAHASMRTGSTIGRGTGASRDRPGIGKGPRMSPIRTDGEGIHNA